MSKTKKKEVVAKSHPKMHLVEVVMTNGSKFQIFTTWGKDGDVLRLDIDSANHPAWQEKGQSFVNVNDERVANFKKKFGDFKL